MSSTLTWLLDELEDMIYICISLLNEHSTLTQSIILSLICILTIPLIKYIYSYFFDSSASQQLLYNKFRASSAGYVHKPFPTPYKHTSLHITQYTRDRAAVISIQGNRRYMEDTYQAIPSLDKHKNWSFYGVYDGHGGARCSVYVAHYLHKHVMAWLNAYIDHYSISVNTERLMQMLIKEKYSFIMLSSTEISNEKYLNENAIKNIRNNTALKSDCIPSMINSIYTQINDETDDDNIKHLLDQKCVQQSLDVKKNHCRTAEREAILDECLNNSENNDLSEKEKCEGNGCSLEKKCTGIPLSIIKIMYEVFLKSHRKADQEFLALANRQSWRDGSTSVCCLIIPARDLFNHLTNNTKINEIKKKNEMHVRFCDANDMWIFVANTGDSRAIIVNSNGSIVEMSHDHKPNEFNERARIQKSGGRIVSFGTWRVEGILAVSRAFGDRMLKKWIIPDPDVICRKIDGNDLFLIMATDGVWDTVSNVEAAKCAIECWKDVIQMKLTLSQRLKHIAQKITSFAYSRGSMDNITTLVVHLPSHNVQGIN